MKNKLIILIILIVVIGVVSYLVIIQKKGGDNESSMNDNDMGVSHEDTNLNVEFSTYQDEKYSYYFDYPKTALIDHADDLSSVTVLQLSNNEYIEYEEYSLSINVGDVNGKTLEEFAELLTLEKGVPVTVGRFSARRVEQINENAIYIGTFFIDSADNYYHFYIEIDPPTVAGEVVGTYSEDFQNEIKNTYDSIINSFRFS